jgi:hypothetical protein
VGTKSGVGGRRRCAARHAGHCRVSPGRADCMVPPSVASTRASNTLFYYLPTEIVDSSGVYCQVRMRGSIEEEVMTVSDVDEIRARTRCPRAAWRWLLVRAATVALWPPRNHADGPAAVFSGRHHRATRRGRPRAGRAGAQLRPCPASGPSGRGPSRCGWAGTVPRGRRDR